VTKQLIQGSLLQRIEFVLEWVCVCDNVIGMVGVWVGGNKALITNRFPDKLPPFPPTANHYLSFIP
jgi:hypothetical protein